MMMIFIRVLTMVLTWYNVITIYGSIVVCVSLIFLSILTILLAMIMKL
jgi:hypothetical protein